MLFLETHYAILISPKFELKILDHYGQLSKLKFWLLEWFWRLSIWNSPYSVYFALLCFCAMSLFYLFFYSMLTCIINCSLFCFVFFLEHSTKAATLCLCSSLNHNPWKGLLQKLSCAGQGSVLINRRTCKRNSVTPRSRLGCLDRKELGNTLLLLVWQLIKTQRRKLQ